MRQVAVGITRNGTITIDGGFKLYILIFTPIPGEMIQFDEHIFQMGWFNHQLDNCFCRLGEIGLLLS